MRKNIIKYIELAQTGDIFLRISFAHKLLKGKLKINFYNESTYLRYPGIYRTYEGKSSFISLNALCKQFQLDKEEILNQIKSLI